MGYAGEQEQSWPLKGQDVMSIYLGVIELSGGLIGLKGGDAGGVDGLLAGGGRRGCSRADAGRLAGSDRRKGSGGHLYGSRLVGGSRGKRGGAGGALRDAGGRRSLRRGGNQADAGLLAGSARPKGGGGGEGGCRRRRRAASQGLTGLLTHAAFHTNQSLHTVVCKAAGAEPHHRGSMSHADISTSVRLLQCMVSTMLVSQYNAQ